MTLDNSVTLDNHIAGETRQVQIREVGPRDGFQNEPEQIPTRDKITLINALGRAGSPGWNSPASSALTSSRSCPMGWTC